MSENNMPITGLMGLIVGDTVGSVYEHHRTKDFHFPLFPPRSHPTDDSVAALAIARWLLGDRTRENLIRSMVRVNLEAPMILTQHLLRDLKKTRGTVVFVSSVTAVHPSPRGAAYGATKAALSSFAASLLAENRKYGLKVITLEPDLTRTGLYRSADFQPADRKEACLDPEDVARALLYALSQPEHMLTPVIRIEPAMPAISRKHSST